VTNGSVAPRQPSFSMLGYETNTGQISHRRATVSAPGDGVGSIAMAEGVIGIDSTAGVRNLRGPVGYLAVHPLVRVACAAAAFATSVYAITRSVRPGTDLKRVVWVALAAITAGEAMGLVSVFSPLDSSPVTKSSAAA
jgi:hypothetical protein